MEILKLIIRDQNKRSQTNNFGKNRGYFVSTASARRDCGLTRIIPLNAFFNLVLNYVKLNGDVISEHESFEK